MSPFNPRKDILPPAQRELWMELLPAQGLGFVLYGGTAIALRLGHRTSEDFDFFTERELHKEALLEAFPFITRSTVLQDRSNSFTVQVPFGRFENHYVKVSFFGSISFGRVGEPGITSDGVLQVASLDDLMANKVKVILQRVSAKDYRKEPAKAHCLSRGIKRASDVSFSIFCLANVFVRTLLLASVRQSFQFKFFGGKRLRHLHRTIDVAAEIWNHAVALHRRYYRLFKKTLPKARLQEAGGQPPLGSFGILHVWRKRDLVVRRLGDQSPCLVHPVRAILRLHPF
jgi:Nucleotidyl transferase AbiEii toxin, Type IV TA system